MSADSRPEAWTPTGRQLGAIGIAVVALVASDTTMVLSAIGDGEFRTDAWGMIDAARSVSSFVRTEWNDVLDPQIERFRPLTHLVIGGWFHLTGGGGLALALSFWSLVLGVVALEGLLLVRLGFRRETALLSAASMAGSDAALRTGYAQQYNDLIIAAFFTLLALNLCFARSRKPPWLVTPVVLLGIAAHESGVLAGPLLIVAIAFAYPARAWREQLGRADVLAVLLPTLWYGLFRIVGHIPGASPLVGTNTLAHNLGYLVRAGLVDRARSFGIVLALWIPIVLLRSDRRLEARRIALGFVWLFVAYVPYLFNALYQSKTYLCVAPLMLVAVVLDPVCKWIATDERFARMRVPIVCVILVAIHGIDVHRSDRARDRFVGSMARALRNSSERTSREPVDVWLFESDSSRVPGGRTFAADQLAVYRDGDSLALRYLVPGRAFHVRFAPGEAMRTTRVDCSAPCFYLAGEGHDLRLWQIDPGARQGHVVYGNREARDTVPIPRWECETGSR